MTILYSLQHLGYVIPPQGDAAWLGEVGPGLSYLDDGSGPTAIRGPSGMRAAGSIFPTLSTVRSWVAVYTFQSVPVYSM